MAEIKVPELDIPIDTPEAALAELEKRGYTKDSGFRYARAARSHTERGSADWNNWLEVERRLSDVRA